METSLGPAAATAVFEEGLGGRILIQRMRIDVPEAPDAFCVIAPDAATGGLTQHYFDSRGVVRLYEMTFNGRVWTLTREKPDFTTLEFAQRYVGTFTDDGSRIAGRWEMRHPGQDWQTDFELTYIRET